MENLVHLLTVLLIFIFVLFVTYFTTRWMAKFSKGQNAGRNIEVIETYRISSNRFIAIVRTGSKYIVLGVGKDNINMLSEIPEDSIVSTKSGGNTSGSFKSLLERAAHTVKKQEKSDKIIEDEDAVRNDEGQ